jgi:pimeloyl-ACP methyl ester carboxylesterase
MIAHPGLRATFAGQGVRRAPLVYVHGGAHTGACYIETPDGRIGWAPYLAGRGHDGYVYDWPGRGARTPDESFVQQSLADVARDLATLIEAIGEPVAIVAHSMGGVVSWRTAELVRERVAAIVGIAPGPPANLQPALDEAEIAELRTDADRYAQLGMPLAHPETAPIVTPPALIASVWSNSTLFPHAATDAYHATIVPESARSMNERNNIRGCGVAIADPAHFRDLPILIVTGDEDPRHPRATDERIAAYLGADFVWLPDAGLPGHGHMQMIEHGNLPIADLFDAWLAERGL